MKKLLFTFILAASPLYADQLIPLTIEQLSGKAQLVVHGSVLSKAVQRDPAGRIYTTIDVAVSEVWKGNSATNHVMIVQGGGVLGDEGQEVSGEATYEIGEELVSFLVLNPRGEPLSLGMAQGKFHVWQDAKTGEKLVRNAVHGLGAKPAGVPRGAIMDRLTLSQLKSRTLGGAK
ncbi:MAG TPA: hypothetical protein VLT36_25775 [Candidatus Dormibacteraeota bacterium]|nr:hypothetical protein [Candidatus Dormibacteraeota bacterium]